MGLREILGGGPFARRPIAETVPAPLRSAEGCQLLSPAERQEWRRLLAEAVPRHRGTDPLDVGRALLGPVPALTKRLTGWNVPLEDVDLQVLPAARIEELALEFLCRTQGRPPPSEMARTIVRGAASGSTARYFLGEGRMLIARELVERGPPDAVQSLAMHELVHAGQELTYPGILTTFREYGRGGGERHRDVSPPDAGGGPTRAWIEGHPTFLEVLHRPGLFPGAPVRLPAPAKWPTAARLQRLVIDLRNGGARWHRTGAEAFVRLVAQRPELIGEIYRYLDAGCIGPIQLLFRETPGTVRLTFDPRWSPEERDRYTATCDAALALNAVRRGSVSPAFTRVTGDVFEG